MKRRVIQIAESTQLISLPRKWALQHGIKKGDELEITERENEITVSTDKGYEVNKIELNVDQLDIMIPRFIHALYKKGADEIKFTFSSKEEMRLIQQALGKEAVGFEITNQGTNFCEIKHVSGELEDFDTVLKRTFLLLISMSEQTLDSLKKNDFGFLPNIAFLEEANNRFTTTCRRLINKKGITKYHPIGPIYYIIEDLENLADEYKYMCNHVDNLHRRDKYSKKRVGNNVIKSFEDVHKMLKEFYDIFYKFDKKKLVDISKKRKQIISNLNDIAENSNNVLDRVVAHHLVVITQKIFCFTGPYLVINM
ncbi:MAG: AbrB/MazE/SpoVT family DNA-binding domain-containing protein [Nanoarchaeota archaeon]|nr:AbrB/MazE/SpoVT family DNA-binding domain-containing protein [Nanoarchaeota archaeon]